MLAILSVWIDLTFASFGRVPTSKNLQVWVEKIVHLLLMFQISSSHSYRDKYKKSMGLLFQISSSHRYQDMRLKKSMALFFKFLAHIVTEI